MRKVWLLILSAILLILASISSTLFSGPVKPPATLSGQTDGAGFFRARHVDERIVSSNAAAPQPSQPDLLVLVRNTGTGGATYASAGKYAELPAAQSALAVIAPASPAAPSAAPVINKPPPPKARPSALDTFANSIRTGAAGLAGLYSPAGLQLRVDQQGGDPLYVTASPGWVSQFALASQYGSIGLLAHNYLSGSTFANISSGQELDAVFGNGGVRRFAVSDIRRFQALRPSDPYSDLLDLTTGQRLSSTATFLQVYKGDRLVLQTCITMNGDPIWGRLFVIATPL